MIMQSDENIGKVAMTAPLVLSTATEQFLIDILKKSTDLTIEAGAKTVTPFRIAQAIKSDPDMYDIFHTVLDNFDIEEPKVISKKKNG